MLGSESRAFFLAAFALAIDSLRAADDLGEFFISDLGSSGCSVPERALTFFGVDDGGVDGAIEFSPLVLGRKRVFCCSKLARASLPVLFTCGGGSLKMDASEGFDLTVCDEIVLLRLDGLGVHAELDVFDERTEPLWARCGASVSVGFLPSRNGLAIRDRCPFTKAFGGV